MKLISDKIFNLFFTWENITFKIFPFAHFLDQKAEYDTPHHISVSIQYIL